VKPLLLFFSSLCILHASSAAAPPNVLFIAIDDLRNDLGALDVAHARTPQLDAFARSARLFSHHYVQVPTCGASRRALLSGHYPAAPSHVGNNGIRDTQSEWAERSLPAFFRSHGYRTLALGKITHYPGGLTGKDWAEGPEELPGVWDRCWIPDGPWKTPAAIMHGYANGVARQPRQSPPWEAHDGPDEAYPDAWVAQEAINTLKELAAQPQPWFFGVGFFKPHLPFAAPKQWHDLHAAGVPDLAPEAAAKPPWPSGWHGSGEFRSNYGHGGRDPATDEDYARLLRRAYAASVSYMDAQVGRVLRALREAGLEASTIVVVWSDHGFLLGEHAIWGKHCLYEQALRAPLIIRHPAIVQPGKTSDAIVESVDLFPTLAELCRLPLPAGLDGRSLMPQLTNPAAPAVKPAHGFWTGGQRTVRTDRWRLIVHPQKDSSGPRLELFDYWTDPEETRNHATARPEVVSKLLTALEDVPQPASAAAAPAKHRAQ
jgi:iduronate 2-sulfatase